MGFEKFRRPEPVTFVIEDGDFVVNLPTRWNRAYNRAWQEGLSKGATRQEDGTFVIGDINPTELQDKQMNAFLEHCLMEAPLSKDELAGEYYPLLEALFQHAVEEAERQEGVADAAIKKSLPSSNGKGDGKVKSISTEGSKAKAA